LYYYFLIIVKIKYFVNIYKMPRKSRYTEKQFKKDLNQLNKLIGNFKSSKGGGSCSAPQKHEDFTLLSGGKSVKSDKPNVRTFTVVEMNGRKIENGGRYKISNLRTRGSKKGKMRKNKPTPGDAAAKALSKFCRDMKTTNKTHCRVTFSLLETTRGGKGKIFGPYYGYYKKLKKPVKRVVVKDGKKKTIIQKYRPMVEMAGKK
tara:strand:- start:2344 stop:2952 length:609 start_codon:yes stop_codon:yes gene_type:complete